MLQFSSFYFNLFSRWKGLKDLLSVKCQDANRSDNYSNYDLKYSRTSVLFLKLLVRFSENLIPLTSDILCFKMHFF